MANGVITLESTRDVLEGRIVWESAAHSPEENNSYVAAHLQVRRNDGYTTKGTWKGSLQVSGRVEEFSKSSVSVGTDWVTMLEFSVDNVPHNDDGTGYCYIKGIVNGPTGTSMAGHKVEGEESVQLDTISRYLAINSFYSTARTLRSIICYFTVSHPRNATYYSLDNGATWIGAATYWEEMASDQKSGSFLIKGLEPGVNYNIIIKVHRADNGLVTYSSPITVATFPTAVVNTAPDSINVGDNATITFNNPSGQYLETYVDIVINGNIVTNIPAVEVTNLTSYTFNFTEDFIKNIYIKLANIDKAIIRYVVRNIEDNQYSYHWIDKDICVVNSNPIFNNFTFVDSNAKTVALTGDNQKLIRYYSNVKATISPSNKAIAQNYASMKTYRLIVGGKQAEASYSDREVNLEVTNIESNDITVYAIDSRNFSTSKQVPPSGFLEYTRISVDTVMATRAAGIGKTVTITYTGKIWNNNFGAVQNSIKTAKYYYRIANTQEWIEGKTILNPVIAGNTFSQTLEIQGDLDGEGFTQSESFEVKVFIEDELSAYETSFVFGSGIPLIAHHKKGVGFGGMYDTSVDAIAQFYGDIAVKGEKIKNIKRFSIPVEQITNPEKFGWYLVLSGEMPLTYNNYAFMLLVQQNGSRRCWNFIYKYPCRTCR